MPFMEMDSGQIFYRLQGEGPTLVLLHGAWASRRWWRWQVRELAEHFQVLTVDVRGHGCSSPLKRASTIQGFAADLERLLSGLEIHRAALCGWSMGGLIALQFAHDYAGRTAALILLATRAHRNPALKARVLINCLRSVIENMRLLAAPRKYEPGREGPGLRPLYEREAARMLAPDAPPRVFEWVVSDLMENPGGNYLTIARSVWNWEGSKILPTIKAPALIMVGLEDTMTPPRFSIRMDQALPDSELLIVPGATHYLALEKPELVNSRIVSFLKARGFV